MTDINAVIAKYKGYYTAPIYVGDIAWFSTEGQLLNPTPPDFEHNANLYMELFEEMPNPVIRKNINRLQKWSCYADWLGNNDVFIDA